MTRPSREVTLDWSRARADRVPIVSEGRLEFGERVMGYRDDRAVRGMVGWDPVLGWVLVADAGQLDQPGLG